MNQLIEEYIHTGTGYNPFLIRNNWQVAQLNHVVGQGLDDLVKIDVHLNTDEVFILLKGQVVLIAAEKNEDRISFKLVKMEEGVTYNIPKMMWHNIAMSEDAQVIIIEDANTHLGDFEYYYLNATQKEELYSRIKSCLKL
jgi:hypothetical protein